MNFEIENNEVSESTYKTVRKEINGIQIVEIGESGCDYLDFALFYYHVDKASGEVIKQLVEQYKNRGTICIIGASDESEDWKDQQELFEYHSSQIKLLFNLAFDFVKSNDFESLVEACVSCRSGLVHGDPQDYLVLGKCSSENRLSLYSETDATPENAANKIIRKIQNKNDNNENCKTTKALMTIFCDEDISLSEINKALKKFESEYGNDCHIIWNMCPPAKKSDERICKIVLIAGE